MVQGLGLIAFTAGTQVEALVEELRFSKPLDVAGGKKKDWIMGKRSFCLIASVFSKHDTGSSI